MSHDPPRMAGSASCQSPPSSSRVCGSPLTRPQTDGYLRLGSGGHGEGGRVTEQVTGEG